VERTDKFLRETGHSENINHYFIHQNDTPSSYDNGKYARSTASGVEWVDESVVTSGTLFGKEYYTVCSDAAIYTTNTSYQEKVKLNMYNISSGIYRIGWCYEWAYSSSSSEFVCKIELDDTTVLSETETRPAPADITSFRLTSGFSCVNLSAGDHYVDIDFKSGSSGKTAAIRSTRIEFWRVS
jgi:hypothetical protein